MGVLALATWIATAGGGLYLLAIWLIEYDRDFQTAAATRLPIPVLSTHALLALSGLALWIGYLIFDDNRLAWAAAAVLVCVAALGLAMAARWLAVYRAVSTSPPGAGMASAGTPGAGRPGAGRPRGRAGPAADSATVPPERNFPVAVVVGHGILATATLVLVVLTALGVSGS